ncbi:MAG: HigA family addiction module antidote protein [Nitrospinae bacterium]|nr:HigA family addiction module antidote protein [Nitrospinota bacterium]
MAMKNPVHPGVIVLEDCLKPLNLTITQGAKRLGVGRQALSNLVNGKSSVSIEMAYRLSKAFGSTPETWLGMQLAYDLEHFGYLERKIKIKRVEAA